MAQINKSSEYFNTVTYSGNGSTQSITGVNFQPDLVWIKTRNSAVQHEVFDAVRGATKYIVTNATDPENTVATSLTSFDSDGFSLSSQPAVNNGSNTFVSWNWLANGAGSSNTQGDITSTVSASTTSGFSIVSYTGNGTGGATIGHGLGVAPKVVIYKRTDSANNWFMYNENIGNTKYLNLESTSAEQTYNVFQDTNPSSTLLYVSGDTGGNASGGTYVAYCFAEKKGFSKFGTYAGGYGADGPFIYTGFKPAFVMIKSYDGAYGWVMNDNKRNTYNEAKNTLFANATDAEDPTYNTCDLLSNGFKLRSSAGVSAINSATNDGTLNYIYMAFAEEPLVGTNNIPATAR